MDPGRVAYGRLKREVYYGREGRIWMFKKGVYYGREG